MELSLEQSIAFNKYIQGHNIFITGLYGSYGFQASTNVLQSCYK